VASLGAFIKLFTQPPSPAEFIDLPTVEGVVNLLALAAAERQQQDEQGPSFRTVDPMADYNESQRTGAFNALQNIPNRPLAGAVAMIPGGAYGAMTRSPEGANPEVPNMLGALDQMSLGGLAEGRVLGGVMRTKPAEPVGPPARLRGRPADEQRPTFSTGKPVEFNFLRNPERAPRPGPEDTFQQKIEPAGRYVVHSETEPSGPGAALNWESGKLRFENPLVLPENSVPGGRIYDENSWKVALSKQFGGKTGRALTSAIKKAGFDGIVTLDAKGNTGEIVDLAGKPARAR